MIRPLHTVILTALILSLAGPALAAPKRMVTYDAVSPTARRLTGAGLTFVFTKTLLRTRILAVRATAVAVGIVPRPSTDGALNRKLDALMGPNAGSGSLYSIDPKAQEGRIMITAFCPGSTKGWLSIGQVGSRRDLRMFAFGDDPTTGEPRLCGEMLFSFHGEWRMPGPTNDGVTDRVFAPDFGRPGT